MAKLYGLHRSTLYEAVSKGRITAGFNPKGQRVVDLSEMIRVYGEPPKQGSINRHFPDTYPTVSLDTSDNALLVELVEINRRQAEQLERMADRIERLESALLRLPAPGPVKATETPSESPKEKSNESPATRTGTVTGEALSFADIEARLMDRLNRK